MLTRIVLLSVVSLLAAAAGTSAAAQGAAEHFTFSPAEAPETGLEEGRLPLVITRWSTDAERDQVFDAMSKKDPQALADVFRSTPNVGYLRWPGGLEYSVRYARKTPRTGGGEDLTLILDRAVWVWWKPDASLHASKSPYTIVQIRFDAKGGEDKLVPLAGAGADKQAGVVVADYSRPPALITDLRRDQRS